MAALELGDRPLQPHGKIGDCEQSSFTQPVENYPSYLYSEYFVPLEHVTSQSNESGCRCCAPFFPFPDTLLSSRFTLVLTWKFTLVICSHLSKGWLGAMVITHILQLRCNSSEMWCVWTAVCKSLNDHVIRRSLFTSPFNNMWTLKFKTQLTIACFTAVNHNYDDNLVWHECETKKKSEYLICRCKPMTFRTPVGCSNHSVPTEQVTLLCASIFFLQGEGGKKNIPPPPPPPIMWLALRFAFIKKYIKHNACSAG